MSELIPLTNGGFTLVDDADVPLVSGHSWWVQYRYYQSKKLGPQSVVTKIDGKVVLMHRLITGAEPGQVVDHANGLPLNNTRANLRVCTPAENAKNRRMASSNRSGVKGIYVDCKTPEHSAKWRACITTDGKKHHLGRFRTKREAAQAYRKAAREFHGAFARVS
jgi:hypothetical protein